MTDKKNLFIVCVLLFSFQVLIAGPFGLEMGMSIDELKSIDPELEKFGNSMNGYLITPPNPHPDFEMYLVQVDAQYGTYFIKAIGKDIETNSYGTELKNEFVSLEKALSNKYGKSEKTDYLFPGSIWDEPDDFMYSLLKGDRYLFSSWSVNNDTDIKDIFIAADATSNSTGYLGLEYYATYHDECNEKAKEQQNSVF